MTDASSNPTLLYAKLLGETAQIGWTELERFFLRRASLFGGDLDLMSVAEAVANNARSRLRNGFPLVWSNACRPQAETAADLAARDPELWAVVTSPWVCVQERA